MNTKLAAAIASLLAFAATSFAQVLEPNVPDVAQCHGFLSQEIVDAVHAATEDPAKAFENWRRDNRNMMEASALVECQSKLYQAFLHRKGLTNFAAVPQGTEALSLRSRDVAGENFLHELAASIGANVDPAGGEATYQGEVQIAINPNNPLQMVAGANTFYRDPDAGCQSAKGGASKTYGTESLYGSTDGGATWVYRCAPWPSAVNGGVSGADEYFGSDPAVAWDSQGRAIAVYMLISANSHNNKSGASIVCMRSTDAGSSWTYLGTVVDNIGSSTLFDDKEFVAVDNSPGPSSTLSHPGRIYVVWDENNVERMAHSDDGATWTTVVLPTAAIGSYDIGGDVKIGPDGTVYAIWNRLIYSGNTQTGEATVFSKSVNGGTTWSTPVTIATQALMSFGTNNTPPAQDSRGINAFGSLTLDTNASSPYFGRLYVTFADFPTGTTTGTNVNVYVVSSSNGGTTWTTRVKVNDDSGTATQFFPWVAVDPTDGSVNVAWYDTRADATNNRKTQFYYARSSNGGTSFETNLVVQDNGGTTWANGVNYSDENTTENTNSNANQYGDYSGIVAYNRKVQPLWTDSRQFYPSAGDARVEDAATATIVNCSAPSATTVTTSVGASCASPSVSISWTVPSSWGTNATSGTYTLRRSTSPAGGGTALLSNTTSTSFSDTTGVANTTYYYSVTATNNCPGTTLTPMSTTTIAAARVYPSVATAPSATVSGNATICDGTSTTISAALTGTAPWVVTWSDGVTQSNISVSPATRTVSPSTTTTYTVTAVSDANCFGSASGSAAITVNPIPSAPTISAGGPTTFCAGGSVMLTASTSNNNQWYLNGSPISGETHHNYVATASGSYTVTNTVSGCTSPQSATTSVTVNPIPPAPTINAGGPTTFCAGSSVTLTSSAASGNQWFLNGNAIMSATNQSYVATASGNYTVQVTLLGCTGSASAATSVTVNPIPATPTINAGGPTTFCAGGSVTLTSSSASGNQWYLNGNPIGGETNQNYIATASGNYTVIVTALGCSSAASSPTTVVVNPIPATPTITPGGSTTFCAGGSVTLTSSSATGNQWYLDGNSIGGATGQQYIATATGSYTVAVSASGCTSASSAPVVVTVNANPPQPTITPSGSITFCFRDTVTLTSSSATGNQWFAEGNAIPGATGQTLLVTKDLVLTYSVNGNAHFSVAVTDGMGCGAVSDPKLVTVLVPGTPTIMAAGPTSFCIGGSVELDVTIDGLPGQWYVDGVAISGATSSTYVATASGSYTFVNLFYPSCPSDPSNAIVVTANPIPATPTITPGSATTFCAGGSVTLTSSSASGNQWYLDGNAITGETNQNYVATTSGSYTVVVTSLGCSSAASAPTNIVVNPIPATPTINAGGPTTFCAGGSVTLTSSSASGNQWYLDGNAITGETNQNYIATTSGNYTVVVTSLGCSSAASAPTNVVVNPIPATPTINAGGPTTFCAGGSVTLTSSSASGNQWYLDGNAITGETNQNYVATTSGNYTVVVTTLGCSSAASAPTNVVVNPIPATPTINAGGPTTFCAGGSVTLTSSSASGNQWYLDGNAIMGATNQAYVASATGSYTVIVTTNGCVSSTSAPTSVTVIPLPPTPTINAGGPTTFCAGGSVTLTSSSASGNQWYLDGNIISGATNDTYSATASGNYTVTVTANGCASAPSAATTVTVNPLPPTPTISANGPTTFCNGNTVTLTSSSASGNQWYRDGNLINGATGTQLVVTASGAYTVRVTNGNGCIATSNPTQVTVTPVTVNPASIPAGGIGSAYGPVTFTESGGSGTASFVLTGTLPTGMTYSAGTLSGTPTQAGSFPITITANDTGGCTGSANYTIVIVAIPTNLAATVATSTSVNVTWTTAAGATGYEISRNGNSIGTSVTTNFTDSTATASTAYLYRVRALTTGSPTLYSAPDLATTIVFTDDPLVAGVTTIKAVHLTQLRSAVNAVRALAGLSAATFTDSNPSIVFIKAIHVKELRNALDPARTTLALPAISYTNSINVGTPARAIDFTELRNGVK